MLYLASNNSQHYCWHMTSVVVKTGEYQNVGTDWILKMDTIPWYHTSSIREILRYLEF
jgi:hypothetical protein